MTAPSPLQFDLFEKKSNDLLASPNYPAFKKALAESNCQKCPELCQTRTHIVVDRGNPQTKIMAIGEAPGQNEDLQGAAFVGRAGQLLDKIMENIGIQTNKDMLIVNVVKCRPPENRAPKPQEASNCFPYLEWQIRFVKPRVILLLGATAAKHLLTGQKMGPMKDQVGRFFDLPAYPGIKFMLLYHPAFLLRDPRKKSDMWEHARILKDYLDGEDFK